MTREAIVAQVEALVEPIAQRYALEVADVELLGQGARTLLRVTVEQPAGAERVGVDELARFSEALSRQLDLRDLIPHAYTLEVTSPGLDRPLKKDRDFQRFAGREVQVTTFVPVEGRRHFTGRLVGLEAGEVRLEVAGHPVRLPRAQVASARLSIDENELKRDLSGGGRAAR